MALKLRRVQDWSIYENSILNFKVSKFYLKIMKLLHHHLLNLYFPILLPFCPQITTSVLHLLFFEPKSRYNSESVKIELCKGLFSDRSSTYCLYSAPAPVVSLSKTTKMWMQVSRRVVECKKQMIRKWTDLVGYCFNWCFCTKCFNDWYCRKWSLLKMQSWTEGSNYWLFIFHISKSFFEDHTETIFHTIKPII